MIKLLQILWYGHSHKWKIIQTIQLQNEYGANVGKKYHLQCEVCGNIKRKEV